MADKLLTEASWKSFAKTHECEDGELRKQLEALAKADGKPGDTLAVLGRLESAIDKVRADLKKKKLLDKDAESELGNMEKAVERERKAAEKLQSEANAAAAAAADDGDEESTELLTTKMVAIVRSVPKGEVIHALIATSGQKMSVLLSHKTLTASSRKILAAHLGDTAGIKYFPGSCIFEENAHTFVLEQLVVGFAKRIKAALLEQVGLKLHIRVRGLDPNDVDHAGAEDGAPGELSGAAAGTGDAAAAEPTAAGLSAEAEAFNKRWHSLQPEIVAALRAQTGDLAKIQSLTKFARDKADAGAHGAALQALTALEALLAATRAHGEAAKAAGAAAPGGQPPGTEPPSAASPGTEPPGVDPAAAFKARLAALIPQARDARAAHGDAGAPVLAKVSEAGAKAAAKDFAGANALLDEAEQQLQALAGSPAPQAAGQAASEATAEAAGAAGAELDGLRRARKAWAGALDALHTGLATLESTLVRDIEDMQEDLDDPGEALNNQEVESGVERIQLVSDTFDEALLNALDRLLKASGETRAALRENAREQVGQLTDYLGKEPLIDLLDANGFVDFKIGAGLRAALQSVSRELDAAGA